MKAVWNDIYPGIGTIKAVVVEKGAINDGLIIGAKVIGADFNFIDNSDIHKEDAEKKMAELVNILRNRDKSQPYQSSSLH